jgi:hypothetical protein
MSTIPHRTRVIIWSSAFAGAFVVLMFVILRAAVPGGVLELTTDLRAPARYISDPKPNGRLAYEDDDGTVVPLKGSPLYFDLAPPGSFEDIDVTVTYRAEKEPFMEIGGLISSFVGFYDARPGASGLLDTLSWDRRSGDGLTLYQREPTYASVEEFRANPPSIDRVAVWETSIRTAEEAPTGTDAGFSRQISLRGAHRMTVHTGGDPLVLHLSVQDMNREEGEDPAVLVVYDASGSMLIRLAKLDDDGNTSDDQQQSGLRDLSISLPDAAAGTYQIAFSATDDMFIRRIESSSSDLVFLDHLYLGDHVGYSDVTPPITVYAAGERISARTAHDEAVQTLMVGDQSLTLAAAAERYSIPIDDSQGPVAVVSPKRDVRLEADGEFALSKESMFRSRPYEISWNTTEETLNDRGIDYVLTSYQRPSDGGDLRSATATFAIGGLARTAEGKFRFVIDVPGLSASDGSFGIHDVRFTLRRDPIGWFGGVIRLLKGKWDPAKDRTGIFVPYGRLYGENVP